MLRFPRKGFFLLLCLLAAPGAVRAQSVGELSPPGPIEADAAHGRIGEWFAVRNLDGEVMQFPELDGRVLFVNFWATWCAPCVQEMPTIVDLAESLEGVDVAFLLISIDENVRDVRRFVDAHEVDRFVYLRAWGPGASTFQAGIVPATFVVDRSRTIAYQHHGAANWNTESIRRFLIEKASANL